MKPSHLQAYAEAYLKGLFFILLQFALAWGVCAARLTPEARAHMFRFDWLTFIFAVLAMSLPACIAFLDGSVERGRQAMAGGDQQSVAMSPAGQALMLAKALLAKAQAASLGTATDEPAKPIPPPAEDPLARKAQTNTGG